MNIILTDNQITELSKSLMDILEAFYQDVENERKFQKWLSEREIDNENI